MPLCRSPRHRQRALINDGIVARKILDHLGLPTEPLKLAHAGVCEQLAFEARSDTARE